MHGKTQSSSERPQKASSSCGMHISGFYMWSKQHSVMSSLCGCFSKHSEFKPLYASSIADSSDYDDYYEDENNGGLIPQNVSEPDFSRLRRDQEQGRPLVKLLFHFFVFIFCIYLRL
ncbi:unnamed protein product [Gongylonema pulchrum]|uniref:Ovule protein n=1 Tax=Gongylonema pulchrum TaxID=637853 RepID=A0A183D4L1_9BILA|nr:unnamed protein product [Gongylonema pulchrum]